MRKRSAGPKDAISGRALIRMNMDKPRMMDDKVIETVLETVDVLFVAYPGVEV
jgi:hypothetical protein